jgi:sugar lactone lactonase YvrE
MSPPEHIFESSPVLELPCTLGEGPLWHPIHQMLYWVDIESMIVHGWEPHTELHREWPVSKRVGTVVASENGNLILGLHGEIAELDPTTGETRRLAEIESEFPENRCNDGQCDPAGRFWVGTMHLETKPGTGSLYCMDKQFKVHKVLTGFTIANGMGWSPEGRFMYFIDSADRTVRRYRFDKEKISLTNEEVILRFDQLPDGMCVDAEGMLWIGFWGGSRVGRYDPLTGKHLADVQVPAPHVTSCCFGGQDLKTLFITTAREGLSPQQLKDFPLSGSLFSCETNATGSSTNFFGQLIN